ncbi:paired box protein Pax-2a-like [Hydra vulgaris]|uniref:paired box protein Pax-2a-like n=1 Tax=Hydra vulgaris TaxID=6087 RepID=UPI001F5FD8D1|nr:paired box protein Pax-2a-like [Hydra vulgaris]
MGRTYELTTEKRAQIVILREQGLTLTSIASRFNVTHSCIIKTLKRYHDTGNLKSKARAGRPKVTTQRADNRIHRYAKVYPFASASEISSEVFPTGVAPSVVTIRRRLCKQFHLTSHVPSKKPCLSPKNIRDRIAFCQKYKDWSAED